MIYFTADTHFSHPRADHAGKMRALATSPAQGCCTNRTLSQRFSSIRKSRAFSQAGTQSKRAPRQEGRGPIGSEDPTLSTKDECCTTRTSLVLPGFPAGRQKTRRTFRHDGRSVVHQARGWTGGCA